MSFAVVALTALGAVLRFATLDRQGFWLDELVTVSLLRLDFGSMLDAIPENEATPYVYYVLAWGWAQVFGVGEVGLRSLSALVGSAIVPVTYGAGAVLVCRRAGLVAAALVSVHPFLVWYAREARSYSLFALLAACTVLFFGYALRGTSRWALLGWAIASSLAIATHYFAAFLVAGEAMWLFARSPARRTALASLLPLAVFVAHVPLVLDQRGAGGAVTEASLLSRVAGVPKGLAVGYSFPAEVAGSVLAAVLLLVGLVLLAARSPSDMRREALVPGTLALLPIAVPLVLALAGADYLIVRNTILAIVPAAICLAAGYVTNRLGLVAASMLCALLVAITLSASLDARYGRTDWRGAAERLATADTERAIVVTPFMSRALWSPYFPGLADPDVAAPRVQEIAVLGLATEGGFSGGAVKPPDVEPPVPPSGFELADDERTSTYTLFLYRATTPMPISTSDLVDLRLTDIQPGILLQHP